MDPKQFTDHTPGPWEMCYDKGATRDILSRKHGGICTIRRAGRHTDATYHANARLIAAAPDLVREVVRLRAGIEWFLARHNQEIDGGRAITGEEWEQLSFLLPNV